MAKLSAQVVDSMIRAWRRARLDKDALGLGYPRTNVLHPTHGIGVGRGLPPVGEMTDAERVQKLVEQMPPEMRGSFEAFHLGVIRGESCREWDHHCRWLILGISRSTYYARVRAGWGFLQDWLTEILDRSD